MPCFLLLKMMPHQLLLQWFQQRVQLRQQVIQWRLQGQLQVQLLGPQAHQ